jgi:hypothetical protein
VGEEAKIKTNEKKKREIGRGTTIKNGLKTGEGGRKKRK